MSIWLILLLIHSAKLISNLIFEPILDSLDNSISYTILNTPTSLSPRFMICCSFKQKAIDDTSFFTIYGENKKPWMSLSNWMHDQRITLWLRVNTRWIKIRDIPLPWMSFGIHLCVFADIHSGNILISANGEQSSAFTIPELSVEAPTNLQRKFFVGFSENDEWGPRQFRGQIANLNVFSVKGPSSIRNMSANPCILVGDILNSNSEWEIVGSVKKVEVEDWKVCNRNQSYKVGIPTRMNWVKAQNVCDKLGAGNITEARSERDIRHTVSLFKNMKSSCEYVWTPLVDEVAEGQYKSSVTGKLVTYLPWKEDRPDGADEENHAVIHLASEKYDDKDEKEHFCTACDLHKSTEFILLGACENTFFGKTFLII